MVEDVEERTAFDGADGRPRPPAASIDGASAAIAARAASRAQIDKSAPRRFRLPTFIFQSPPREPR
jgi:hypothetical protein